MYCHLTSFLIILGKRKQGCWPRQQIAHKILACLLKFCHLTIFFLLFIILGKRIALKSLRDCAELVHCRLTLFFYLREAETSLLALAVKTR